jgi:hypothetical protein
MYCTSEKLNESETEIFVIIGCVKFLCLIFLSVLPLGCAGQVSPSAASDKRELQEEPAVFQVQDYKKHLAAIEQQRASLTLQYQKNTRNTETLENTRRTFVHSIYKEVIPFWYETEWDFYGMTETPRQGKIACGYFVTTVLRDAGLKVERAKLAQQASEKIILSLTNEDYVKRFRNAKIEDFVEAIEKWGEGVYLVGLDFHVGFIINDGGKTYFIHSSYIEPRRVVKETAAGSEILASSKYRIIGKISADNELLTKWLLQKNIATK